MTAISENEYCLFDKIFGIITLHPVSKVIISHNFFKRLNSIYQLGTLHFKFKYATETRYSHSIGVAYLANYIGKIFKNKYNKITNKELLLLELAALCHDLGHGIYSHSYDHFLQYKKTHLITRHHEVRSMIIFEYMIKDLMKKNELPVNLTEQDIRLVQFFIDPIKYKQYLSKTKLTSKQINTDTYYPKEIGTFYVGLEQIVNNVIHKVDIDKLDYLIRDAQSLRVDQSFSKDINILDVLQRTAIIDGIWSFDIKINLSYMN